MRDRLAVSKYGRWSFLAGWLIAGGLTTLYERGHLWSFWPAALLGIVAIVGGNLTVSLIGDRLARRLAKERGSGD